MVPVNERLTRMRLNMTEIETRLNELKDTVKTLASAETFIEHMRDRKWDLVSELKKLGHDFTATTEGMDVVLSAPPSMRF